MRDPHNENTSLVAAVKKIKGSGRRSKWATYREFFAEQKPVFGRICFSPNPSQKSTICAITVELVHLRRVSYSLKSHKIFI